MATRSYFIPWSFCCFLSLFVAAASGEKPDVTATGVFVVGTEKSILCYITTAQTNINGLFPLVWTRESRAGVAMQATESTSVVGVTNFRSYTSTVRFTVTKEMNREEFICTASLGNAVESSTWRVYVHKPPELPSITGPTQIFSGVDSTWTCRVSGASSAPNVYWQFGNGSRIIGGVTDLGTTITADPDNAGYINSEAVLRFYDVSRGLRLNMDPGSPPFLLSCVAVHYDTQTQKASEITVNVYYTPQVTGDANYTVTVGAQASIKCSVTATPSVTSVSWYKDDNLLSTSALRYQGGTVSNPSLTILSVERGDAGKYVCTASNTIGSGNSGNSYVTVRYAPIITYNTTTFGGNLGEDVVLPCPIDSEPAHTAVIWYRISSITVSKTIIVVANEPSKYSGGTQATPALTIKGLTSSDSGMYRCAADNSVGRGEGADVTVQVFYSPVVSVGATSYTKNSGDSLQIPCSYDSNPSATKVTWTKNSQIIDVTNSNGKYSGSTLFTPSLTIFGLASTDAGLYVCGVVNSAGPGYSSDVSVVVNYSPQVNSTVTLHNKGKGETVTLQCAASANPPPTQITWYANNVPLTLVGSGSKYSGGTVTTPDLTIYFLAGSDTADYYCKVDNSVGSANGPLIKVNVNYPPSITSPTNAISGNEGSALTIPCTYDANPLPTQVVWLKSGIIVDVTNPAYSGGTPGTPSLTIFDLNVGNAGSYVCSVTNSQGTGSSGIIPVSVNYGPRMDLSGPSDLSSSQGQSVTIPCNFTATPAVTSVLWLRNGVVIDTSNPTDYLGGTTLTPALTVRDLQSSDNGFYRCRVTNPVGTSEGKNVSVYVSFKPEITVQPQLEGNASNTLVIPCNVSALPAITSLTWYQGQQIINTSDTTRYSGGTTVSPSLTILKLEPKDAGNYYCVATNSKGTTFGGTTALTVNYKPIITGLSEVGGKLLDTVTLDISIAAYPSATNIRWRRRGTDVNVNDSKYGGGILGSPGLQIRNLATNDVGVYVVEVTNAYGVTAYNVTVAVSYAPTTPNITNLESAYKEGETIQLTCSSNGFPSPQYRWYRNNVLYVPQGQSQGATFSDVATPVHNAAFKCEAYNREGSASATVSVVVRYKPRPATTLTNMTATIGDTVALVCAVDSNPQPYSYTWTWNGQTLYSGNRSTISVTVFNSTYLSGYQCTANNSIGTSPSITVYVSETPNTTTPRSGQSTEDSSGLSTATLVLIIIVCIIILVVLILIIVYCCCNKKCMKKDNNVEPTRHAVLPEPHYVQKKEPMVNGFYDNRLPPTKTQNGRIDVTEDESKPLPTAANGSVAPAFTRLGHGMSISVPGGQTPKPHHLPPLGQDGAAQEHTPAEEVKNEKKKKRRRKRQDEAGVNPNQDTPSTP